MTQAAVKAPKIDLRPVEKLLPYPRNARTHSEEQIGQIAASIREFGWTNPVLLDGQSGVIAGHARLLAARQLGLKQVPCIELAHLTEAQKRAYILADNRLALNAGWDLSLLAGEIQELKAEDFDLNLLGFEEKELGELLAYEEGTPSLTDPDEVPGTPEEPVTQPGDLWVLGKHRLLCGDATKAEDVERLLNHAKDLIVITDPPYGLNIVKTKTAADKGVGGGGKPYGKSGVVGGGGSAGHMYPYGGVKKGVVGGENIVKPSLYSPVINDGSTDTAENFYRCVCACNLANLIIFGGNYFTHFLPPSRCWIIWDKQNSGNFAAVEIAWTSYDRGSRLYQWMWNGLSRAGDRKTELEKRVHPTQKPVGLFEKIFADFLFEKCFDGFLGSGSTLIACEKAGRTCYGMELSPAYCDVILTRWQNFTGKQATLDGTKQTFDQISQKRAA
jgi:hypothetical protein